MVIKKAASAGTQESSDAQVIIEPGENGIELELTSTVIHQYGRQIRALVKEELERMNINSCIVTVNDHGALDCTLRARVEAAVYRAAEQYENIPWGGSIR